MTNSEIFETPKDLESTDGNNSGRFTTEKFYTPLCLTGYLTPLQRKKLREKRNLQTEGFVDSRVKEVKKSRVIKRKNEHGTAMRDKSKERIKRIKVKDNTQRIQCTISKLVHKTADTNIKDKKFFKSSSAERLEKANFTMPLVLKRNVFLDIDKCVKETFSHPKKFSPPRKDSSCDAHSKSFDSTKDFECENVLPYSEENLHENICSVQNCMSQNSEISGKLNPCSEKNVSIEQISHPTKEMSVFEFDWPSDEQLLERQEKARAVHRKQNVLRDSNVKHKDVENENIDASPVKLYPVFHIAVKKHLNSKEKKRIQKNVTKKIKDFSKGGEQMIIDAGQKEIGAKVCKTCNMIYTICHDDDEKLHLNYHNTYLSNLKFPGWKDENVIGEYCDGRVIMIRMNEKSFKLKKMQEILEVANRDLGFPSSQIPAKQDLAFLMFISNKQVAGCVVAEPISSACHAVLADNESASKDAPKKTVWRIGNWYSSCQAVPAVCGVNRIWVTHDYRRHKVASRMVDCLRCHFIHGHVIGIHELAFTDPSPDGRDFAAAYTKTDNFLVYK